MSKSFVFWYCHEAPSVMYRRCIKKWMSVILSLISINPWYLQRITEEHFEILFEFSFVQDFTVSITHWIFDTPTSPVLPENDGTLWRCTFRTWWNHFFSDDSIFVSGKSKIPTYLKWNSWIPLRWLCGQQCLWKKFTLNSLTNQSSVKFIKIFRNEISPLGTKNHIVRNFDATQNQRSVL